MSQHSLQSDAVSRVLIILMGIWCALIVTPAIAGVIGLSSVSEAVNQVFTRICHQRPERSFYLLGWKLGVCARCASIYFSFSVTAAFVLCADVTATLRNFLNGAAKHSRAMLIGGVAPMLVDVLLNDLGIRESTLVTRSISGCMFGIIAAPVLIPQVRSALPEVLPILFTRFRYAQKTR